ncbi:hypothetical protein IW140_001878 [Coemansia sp. RSA 1813]|nr:hypothetical protein LPJ74_001468 [Coemansia sp. RSA 1843]KAJ2091102.1 hypothetical protein IW138_002064 [Coemansia sp. RSA 986]KAJ2212127.1 hypothetical protein EV179_004924 [Coemansia sp. RSA 487]KAJ2571175.1 hypothetical protein IW140_001878 [Coemansia sp. RSA 1813]
MKLLGIKRLLAAVTAFQAAVLAKDNTTSTKDNTVTKRDVTVNDVLDFKSALLLIDGKETSCESALIDSGAGFVAASCLKFTGSKVDMTRAYELVIKMGRGSSPTVTKTISSIDVHPEYDSGTLVNNLAVVQFGDGSNIEWHNYIGIDPSEWNNLYFIRRSLQNVPSRTWSDVIAYSSTDTPDKCLNASTSYAANPKDFLCNYAASLSIFNQECKIPYGTVFAAIQPSDVAVVALHSHSAVYGNSMCSQDTKLHYYTLLRNYLAWAATTLNRAIGGFVLDASYDFSPDSSYSMKSASKSNIDGVDLFYGDQYAQDPIDSSLSADIYRTPASQTGPTNSGGTPTPTDSAGNGSKSSSPTNADGSSHTNDASETGSSSKNKSSSKSGSDHSKTGSDAATDSNTEIGDLSNDSENGDTETDSLSESNSDSSDSSGGSGGVSPIAIVIPVIIVILIIGGAGIVWYVRRRRKKNEERMNALNNANNEDDDDDITPMHHPNESTSSIMNYYQSQDPYNPHQQAHPQQPPPIPPMPPMPPQQHTMSQYTTNSHMFNQPYTARSTQYDGNL